MKILVYADLHAGEGSDRLYSDPSVPLQRWRVREFFTQVQGIVSRLGIDAVWDLGDTTDDRTSIPIPTVDTLITGLTKLPTSPENIKLIGNHEQYYRNTKLNLGGMYARVFNTVEDLDVFDLGQTAVIAVAYPQDYALAQECVVEALAELRPSYRHVVVIGHGDIIGASMGSGTSISGFDPKVLARADLALFGHVHLAQSLGQRVHYVGSCFEQDFGERGQDKFLTVLDTDTLAMSRVRLSGFPRYEELDYQAWVKTAPTGGENRYRVRLASESEAQDFYRHDLAFRAQPVLGYAAEPGPNSSLDQGVNSVPDLFRTWVETHPMPGVNADDLVKAGLELAEQD